MKIDTATSHLYASQSAQSSTAARTKSASFSAALSAATAATSRSDAQGAKQADFTSMTRQQMQEWSNDQIRSGKMSLDEGRPFMAMSMKIPVVAALVASCSLAMIANGLISHRRFARASRERLRATTM